MSGENGEKNFFNTYPGNSPPGQGGPGIPSGRFAKIYKNIANIRTDLNRFNTTLKKPPQSKPQTPSTKVNMNQLRELEEGMNKPPKNEITNQSNFNKMTSKLEELKKGRRQSRKNRSNKSRKNRNTRRKRRN